MKWREGRGVTRARKAVAEAADAYALAAASDADSERPEDLRYEPSRYDARRTLDAAVDRLVLSVRSDARVRRVKEVDSHG